MTRRFIEETAVFANQTATVILVNVEEDGSILNIAIDVSPNPLYSEFSKSISLDTVRSNTVKREKELQKADNEYRQYHLDEVKKFIVDDFADSLKNEIKKSILEEFNLFSLVTESDLIGIKTQLFSMDVIKNSNNTELKKSLRKSITVMETLAYAITIIIEENKK